MVRWSKAIGLLLATVLALGCLPQTSRASEDVMSYFGVNEHPHIYSNYADIIDQMASEGVKWVRISPEWRTIQPNDPGTSSNGGYNDAYLAKLQDIVNRLRANRIEIVFVLLGTPMWASSQPSSPDFALYPPADLADWEQYVSFITTKFKDANQQDQISRWEVWNEEDFPAHFKGSVDDYWNLLTRAYNVIHDPSVHAVPNDQKVLLGGLALTTDGANESYAFLDSLMSQIKIANQGTPFDLMNVHLYGNGNTRNIIRKYETVVAMMQSSEYQSLFAGRKIWVTETGMSAYPDMYIPVSDEVDAAQSAEYHKADFLDQLYTLYSQWPDIEKVFWYVFKSTSGNSSTPTENYYGLLDADLNPLRANWHYQASGGAANDLRNPFNPNTTLTVNTTPFDSGLVVSGAGAYPKVAATKSVYFALNDNWLKDTNGGLDPEVTIDVTYLDSGTGTFALEYDSAAGSDTASIFQRAYTNEATPRGSIALTNGGDLRTVTFRITDAKFGNRQYGAGDFRIRTGSEDVFFDSVVVKKRSNQAKAVMNRYNQFKFMEPVLKTDAANTAYTVLMKDYPDANNEALDARKVPNGHFLSLRVSGAIAGKDDHTLIVTIRYLDRGNGLIRVDYNSTDSDSMSSYTIQKTNTNLWRSYTKTIADASFDGALTEHADIRISSLQDANAGDEYIRSIEVVKP
ncbi:glycosyl hydrolase [Cohnella fermenti]|uniref:Uncharacterized protein n=1 Tax=Cohnella fermenti TaxID=2565925 RepID=A0A4S4BP94_9BACL|nr:glycosyl hydrolase [Cohnella fermenti]THF76541.1 hypothetical protein E6C55_18575 [Cohnella fermenti]